MIRKLIATAATAGLVGVWVPAAAQTAQEQQLTEIDKPASELNEILKETVAVPQGDSVVRVVRATMEPNTIASWHTHPSPVYVYVEEGTLTMEIEGEEPYQISAGEAVAEPLDVRMRVLNRTEEPAEIVVFQVSPAESEFLEEEPQTAEVPEQAEQSGGQQQ